jgi:hypothetical protein
MNYDNSGYTFTGLEPLTVVNSANDDDDASYATRVIAESERLGFDDARFMTDEELIGFADSVRMPFWQRAAIWVTLTLLCCAIILMLAFIVIGWPGGEPQPSVNPSPEIVFYYKKAYQ